MNTISHVAASSFGLGPNSTCLKVKDEEDVSSEVEVKAEVEVGDGFTKIAGTCDICERRDGFRNQNLQQCKECNILVHEQCYGITPTDRKNPSFVCHACKSVGSKIEVNIPSVVGGKRKKCSKRGYMVQSERPTECVLCSHDTGIHAMHPLLDTHGPNGRQFVLPAQGHGGKHKEERLAWVHTLCASVICSNPMTAGCVYGCFRDRSYEPQQESEGDESENENEYENGSDVEEANGSSLSDTCFYAIAGKDHGEETAWTKAIKNNCTELKCFICGKKNGPHKIPIQCIAGDESEVNIHKHCHLDMDEYTGTECSVAMHVGCARWGYQEETEGYHLEHVFGRPCRLCYFLPGYHGLGEDKVDKYGDKIDDVVSHCYCMAHARDIVVNNPKLRKENAKTAVAASPGRNKNESVRQIVSPGQKSPEQSSRRVHDGSFHSMRRTNSAIVKKNITKTAMNMRRVNQNDSHRRQIVTPGSKNSRASPQRDSHHGSRNNASCIFSTTRTNTSMVGTACPRGTMTLMPRKRKYQQRAGPLFGGSSSSRKKSCSAVTTNCFPVKGKSERALGK